MAMKLGNLPIFRRPQGSSGSIKSPLRATWRARYGPNGQIGQMGLLI